LVHTDGIFENQCAKVLPCLSLEFEMRKIEHTNLSNLKKTVFIYSIIIKIDPKANGSQKIEINNS
jgi:hypothetical protein